MTHHRQRVAIAPIRMDPVERAVVDAGAVITEIDDADVLVWLSSDAAALRDALAAAPHLRWIQLAGAGVNWAATAGLLDSNHQWSCLKGAYGTLVAEHGIALMLAASRRLHELCRKREWDRLWGRSLAGSNALFLGGGGIASTMIKMLAPFGVRSIAVRRRATEPVPGAALTTGVEAMESLLPNADWLVLALPLTPETCGAVDLNLLRKMKSSGWVVNVARGEHVVTDDLVTALGENLLGGAALDVTHPEPLPANHPLWDMDNVILTPHVATANVDSVVECLNLRLAENLERDRLGLPLAGLVDVEGGY